MENNFEKTHGISIAEATKKDISEIAQLHHAIFNNTYPNFPKIHTPEDDLKYLGEILEKNKVLIVRDKEKIIAFCAFTEGWLNELYIASEYQGRGIGADLLNRVKEKNNELQLWTYQVNSKARKFYENNGFKIGEIGDGSYNEYKQPDIKYIWKKK